MKTLRSSFPLRRSLALVAGLALAASASASRISGAAAPAASAVQAGVQEPAHLQADESASLRQGTIQSVDAGGSRLQVQGIWLALSAGKTRLLRGGKPAALDTLKAGESIRFAVGAERGSAPTVRVIYVD